ncbi:transcriptional regulator [Streptomyces sp. NPDC059568]|uniref:transcriptional regulator n=1 Tax=Streptomyces sp. NPDC059568 TaxID=3346868 RepID=UPI0036C08788
MRRSGPSSGLAQSDVSEIERGLRLVQSVEVLVRIATGLNIPLALLGLTDARSTADADAPKMRRSAAVAVRTAARVAGAEQEDDVRRREFMAGALGLGAGMIAGTGSETAGAQAAAGNPAAAMELALFEPTTVSATQRPADLSDALSAARSAFADARYADLGGALPSLIAMAEATRDGADGHRRERAQAVVARSYVLATELAVKQHSEVAWATADRALTAARASGDPQSISEAARVLAITMRRAGRSRAAVDFLARTASSLETEKGTPTAETLAAKACLLMTAAYTAASGGRRSTALDLLQEAEETSGRIPTGGEPSGLFTISASPTECAVYRISAYNALGTPDDAVPFARRVIPAQLASTQRVARYLTDTARMWHQLGDGPRTYSALRAIERRAPEEVRRPALRTLTNDLLYTPQSLPGLREFAVRTGAVPA